jgi:hypothetical protein
MPAGLLLFKPVLLSALTAFVGGFFVSFFTFTFF